MARFTDDARQFKVYTNVAGRTTAPPNSRQRSVGVLQWPLSPVASTVQSNATSIRSVEFATLAAEEEPPLRIIFAPPDEPSPETVDLITAIIDHYQIPPAFVMARLQAVTQVFGTRRLGDKKFAAWLHVLCKNVNSESDVNGKLHIVDPRKDVFVQSQSEGTWIKQAFYLCWGTNHGGHMNTTLICFGGHRELEKRFESLQFHPAWEECIKSPLTLFAILLEELFLILDNQVWTVASVVRDIEWEVLNRPSSLDQARGFDFVGLHNIAKHIIHLIESATALVCSAKSIHSHSIGMLIPVDAAASQQTSTEIEYQMALLNSVNVRLRSLATRTEAVVNLAFNLVTQQDSKIVQRDSYSMKTIAAATLFFLPISTIATVFGSQFFYIDPDTGFKMSGKFWLFWLMTIPTTGLVVGTWVLYHKHAEKRFKLGSITEYKSK